MVRCRRLPKKAYCTVLYCTVSSSMLVGSWLWGRTPLRRAPPCSPLQRAGRRRPSPPPPLPPGRTRSLSRPTPGECVCWKVNSWPNNRSGPLTGEKYASVSSTSVHKAAHGYFRQAATGECCIILAYTDELSTLSKAQGKKMWPNKKD
jgi:hypothetical protein